MHITTKLIIASAATMAVVAGGSAAFAAAKTPGPKITAEQAIDLAKREVPSAWVRDVDHDDHLTKPDTWEVELIKGDLAYEIKLDSATGKVLERDTDAARDDDEGDDD